MDTDASRRLSTDMWVLVLLWKFSRCSSVSQTWWDNLDDALWKATWESAMEAKETRVVKKIAIAVSQRRSTYGSKPYVSYLARNPSSHERDRDTVIVDWQSGFTLRFDWSCKCKCKCKCKCTLRFLIVLLLENRWTEFFIGFPAPILRSASIRFYGRTKSVNSCWGSGR